MDLDMMNLKPFMDDLFWNVIKIAIIPAIIALAVGFILKFLRVPNAVIRVLVSLLYVYLFYLSILNFDT